MRDGATAPPVQWRRAFEALFLILFGLGVAAVAGFGVLCTISPSHEGEVPVKLGASAVAVAVLVGSWQLGRRGRPVLACLLLVLGLPATLLGFVVMLLVAIPGAHH